jgi:Fur family ferric uptake transcriptional regulator
VHTRTVEDFRGWLSTRGLKFTRQREAIVEAFLEAAGEHLSLDELLERAKARQPSVGYATVYRTMKVLAESGLAIEHKFAEGQVRYEAAVDGGHHDHLICTLCGKILEFEDDRVEQFQHEVAAAHQMRVVSHRHEIYAECVRSDCPDRPASGVAATRGPQGNAGTIAGARRRP